jgi:hypothetical protein
MKHRTLLPGACWSISGVVGECQPIDINPLENPSVNFQLSWMQFRAPLARVAGPRVMSVLQKRAVPAR